MHSIIQPPSPPPPRVLQWSAGETPGIVYIIGDSELCINWLNGAAVVEDLHGSSIAILQEKLAHLLRQGCCRPPSLWLDPARHVYRSYNKDADKLANDMVDGNDARLSYCDLAVLPYNRYFAITFDGASRDNPGKGSSAAIAWYWQHSINPADPVLEANNSKPGVPGSDSRWKICSWL